MNQRGIASVVAMAVLALSACGAGSEEHGDGTSCSPDPVSTGDGGAHVFGTLTDHQGHAYRTVVIGSQTWMADNLTATEYDDGTPIPVLASDASFAAATGPACGWSAAAASAYGALYNWHAVSGGEICPPGWRVPSAADWAALAAQLGGMSVAGSALKEAGTGHWAAPNTSASNASGFTGLPAGYRADSCYARGLFGGWWSATEASDAAANSFTLHYDAATLEQYENPKSLGLAVRCLRDT